MDNYFVELNSINVSDKTEKKNGLTYLSWPWAWGELKKRHPDATYTVYEDQNGRIYHSDGRTCWVKTGVTVAGIEHIEYLPIMDYKNRSIPAEQVTSMDANKAIQRSLTKAVARHGLGLYIYAGEDLPEDEKPGKADGAPEADQPMAEKPHRGVPYHSDAELMAEIERTGLDLPEYFRRMHVKALSELTAAQAHSLYVSLKDRESKTE